MEGLEANDGVGVDLGPGGEDGADSEVVDRKLLGGGKLCGVVGREAEDGIGADDLAGGSGGEVGLADVEAEAEEGGVVGTVIENEISFAFSAGLEGFEEVPGEVGFVADLDPGGSPVDGSFEDILQRMAVELSRIQNWIERHYSWTGA